MGFMGPYSVSFKDVPFCWNSAPQPSYYECVAPQIELFERNIDGQWNCKIDEHSTKKDAVLGWIEIPELVHLVNP